jgi:hypothetical protein
MLNIMYATNNTALHKLTFNALERIGDYLCRKSKLLKTVLIFNKESRV